MADYVPDPEITELVRELNKSARGEVRRVEGPAEGADLDRLLAWASAAGATDLLLLAGSEPAVRLRGDLVLVGGALLGSRDVRAMVQALLDEEGQARLESRRSLDLGFSREGLGRFRCNIHFQRGTPALAVRILPETIPSLEELHLPGALARLVDLRRGLVLVTGPSGSGKSTTMAALLTAISQRRQCHILTIEDPIEYRLTHGRSLVEQIQVGRDATSFAGALRAALRQDPDVILVGEMRDLETIAIALTAAETGHLVLSTLHTGDTSQALERVIDVFPPDRHQQLRVQVAGVLKAILSQILLPGRGPGAGRYPACEVLLATDAVRHKIRKGETHQLHHELTLGKTAGMCTLEESLARLVRDGLVDLEEARSWATHREEFEGLVAGE